ncbi:MAG TPA: helix-turn-helix transcriptional regulator [Rhizomicrobium sp.]|jgi:transcriptional regulator with XRE-family HTH domain|nr:helix-turn-helix transcriptional regulator [Rhizomicrobium sp.]
MDGHSAQTRQTARSQPERTIDDYVGERIRQRRTELGQTQEELGKLLNLSYQQVQKYETGANRVSAGRLYEIAREMGVGVSYFFDGYDEGGDTAPLPHGGHNRAAIELVRNFLEIRDEPMRSAVSSLLKAMKDQQG